MGSASAAAIAASVPIDSRCSRAIEVITCTLGAAMAANRSFSPGADIPSSSTAAAASSGWSSSVSGRPRWLLRLPWVQISGVKAVAKAAAK